MSDNFGEPPWAATHRAKTHCPVGHPYEEGNLTNYASEPGRRRCLKCRRAYMARKMRMRSY